MLTILARRNRWKSFYGTNEISVSFILEIGQLEGETVPRHHTVKIQSIHNQEYGISS